MKRSRLSHHMVRRRRQGCAVLLSAILFSSSSIGFSQTISVDSVPVYGTLGFIAGSAPIAAAITMASGRIGATRLKAAARQGVTVGLMLASAYGLVLVAYTRADAANVATLRATSIIFGLALVRQTLTRPLVAGAGLVVAGSIMVAW